MATLIKLTWHNIRDNQEKFECFETEWGKIRRRDDPTMIRDVTPALLRERLDDLKVLVVTLGRPGTEKDKREVERKAKLPKFWTEEKLREYEDYHAKNNGP